MAIVLEKGQKISLEKEAGTSLTKIFMGLGWDAAKPEGFLGRFKPTKSIDLDASCLMFDENKNIVDQVWFRQYDSKDGAIKHTGDNRTGDGDGDDERIIVDLTKVSDKVKSLVFTVNSFTGQGFEEIANATCRIVNQADDKEIASYNLSCKGKHTGMIMTKLYRHADGWKLHAIGENSSGRTFHDMMGDITPYL